MDEYVKEELNKDIYEPEEAVSEFDALLVDEDQPQLHYVELKASDNCWFKAENQIERAAYLITDLGYKFSASRIAWKQDRTEHLSWEEIKEDYNLEVQQSPVNLESAINSLKPNIEHQRLVPLPIEPPQKSSQTEEEPGSSIIDQRPPHKAYHYLFHTHTVEEQLDQRFDEIPERDYVNVAYIPNRSIDWIRDLQEMKPENYSELEKTPPSNIDELIEKMNIVHYSDWSDTIKQELTQEELEELEDTFIVVKQPIEKIFNEEST